MEIEALLKKVEQLAPQFGRASDDLAALVGRARSNDYKGAMQSARLVLEMLLRSLVATELKQTPGKAMLDELITKFRQSANSGVVPTTVLAHMGTVQAWGNLSSHDHAGSLHDEGVRVGLEEAATALNSMLAILTWYAAKYPSTSGPAGQPVPPEGASPVVKDRATPYAGSSAVARPLAQKSGGRGMALGIAAVFVLAAAGGGAYVLFMRGDPAGSTARLDGVYRAAGEPVPPGSCRPDNPALLGKLSDAAGRLSGADSANPEVAVAILRQLEAAGAPGTAEHWYFLAKAKSLAGQPAEEELARARACKGFAAAENLAGNAAVRAKDLAEAEARYAKALELAPAFRKARFNLAMLKLQQSQLAEAVPMFEALVAKDAKDADSHFFLGMAHEALSRAASARGDEPGAKAETAAAKESFCKAAGLGKAMAAERCK
ncbi:MAG: tetratricopeptide repeat protein [Myxococcales bacterium]|nr:tetratricopeptide repeat protein [Myxococcales bacterium]